MSNEKLIKSINDERQAVTEGNLKRAAELALNSDEGICVKDLAREFNISSNSARRYMLKLLDRDWVFPVGKVGKTVLYKARTPQTEENPEPHPVVEEAPKEDLMPVGHSGKEFEPGSYIPCTDQCKPGDVVWISSRSGEGAFFRYLIITPWEHKAMVLGIFEEGHPKLDLNDPYYCYIGQDPEKGVNLYADLRNNCQRGYKQFGERLMHVDQDLFDDVKARLARSMGIDRMKVKEADPDVIKLLKNKIAKLEDSNKKGAESVKKLLARIDGSKLEMDGARTLLNERNKKVEQLQEANDRQTETINELLAATRKDAETIKELEKRNVDLEKMVNELDDQLEKYEPATPAAPQQTAVFDNDLFTGMVIDSKVKETKIEMLEDQVKMLRQMVFNMIKGGGVA